MFPFFFYAVIWRSLCVNKNALKIRFKNKRSVIVHCSIYNNKLCIRDQGDVTLNKILSVFFFNCHLNGCRTWSLNGMHEKMLIDGSKLFCQKLRSTSWFLISHARIKGSKASHLLRWGYFVSYFSRAEEEVLGDVGNGNTTQSHPLLKHT